MKVIYNTLFKRTSTYAVAIIASAFFFERAIDVSSNMIFDSINKGVSFYYVRLKSAHFNIIFTLLQKQWKDIKSKYE